jgi:SAM-dependent methyltransferase
LDHVAFTHLAATEGVHWWFVGRRAVIESLLDTMSLPEDGEVLEAGCGTGGNLAMLARRGRIRAFEPHIDALAMARAKNPGLTIEPGSLPDGMPFPKGSFDLVAALDILEHIGGDRAAARGLVEMARPGGSILVTVPAHQWLWGSHDRRLFHLRRYGKQELLDLFSDCDVDVVRLTAFNLVLAPLAVAYRILEKAIGVDLGNQERVPPRLLNLLLGWLFSAESAIVQRNRTLPIGLSYALVLRRQDRTV